MAEIVLQRADMALISDLTRRVRIPTLIVMTPKRVKERAFVRFMGDTKRTGFRGEGEALTMSCTAHYAPGQHQDLADLQALFQAADDDPDGRILLRSHLATAGDLNLLEAVLITDTQETWAGAGFVDFPFTAEAVAWTPGV